ncbi:hypothetical protein GQR58_029762 [Nymphon striatum]|nr:hypothetical protein GQR58_029762 [Nymphon striatum]
MENRRNRKQDKKKLKLAVNQNHQTCFGSPTMNTGKSDALDQMAHNGATKIHNVSGQQQINMISEGHLNKLEPLTEDHAGFSSKMNIISSLRGLALHSDDHIDVKEASDYRSISNLSFSSQNVGHGAKALEQNDFLLNGSSLSSQISRQSGYLKIPIFGAKEIKYQCDKIHEPKLSYKLHGDLLDPIYSQRRAQVSQWTGELLQASTLTDDNQLLDNLRKCCYLKQRLCWGFKEGRCWYQHDKSLGFNSLHRTTGQSLRPTLCHPGDG